MRSGSLWCQCLWMFAVFSSPGYSDFLDGWNICMPFSNIMTWGRDALMLEHLQDSVADCHTENWEKTHTHTQLRAAAVFHLSFSLTCTAETSSWLLSCAYTTFPIYQFPSTLSVFAKTVFGVYSCIWQLHILPHLSDICLQFEGLAGRSIHHFLCASCKWPYMTLYLGK